VGGAVNTIIRVEKRGRWTTILSATLEDSSISYRARGVLASLLAKPDDWHADLAVIVRGSPKEGRDCIYGAIKELTEAGYITRVAIRENGRITSWELITHETPNPQPTSGLPVSGELLPDLPHVVLPQEANPHTTKETKALKTQRLTEDTEIDFQGATDLDLPEPQTLNLQSPAEPDHTQSFAEFWETYPTPKIGRKPDKEKCARRWAKMSPSARSAALIGVRNYRRMYEDTGTYVAYPMTWLNDAKWNTWLKEYVPKGPKPSNGHAMAHIPFGGFSAEEYDEKEIR
jgi:hypothetical protein